MEHCSKCGFQKRVLASISAWSIGFIHGEREREREREGNQVEICSRMRTTPSEPHELHTFLFFV